MMRWVKKKTMFSNQEHWVSMGPVGKGAEVNINAFSDNE